MVKFPLPADTFPRLILAQKDIASLEGISAQLVENTLAQYHAHAVECRGVVDESRWTRVRQKDDIRVFKERKSARRAAPQQPVQQGEPKVAPQVMTTGTMRGDLDDVMFGVLNPSTEAMRIKSHYADEGFVDGSVLATLIKPSHLDPLRSLTLRWCVKGNPVLISGFIRLRDVVYIESTGIAFTEAGERIGYQIMHSVEIPEARSLMEYDIVRSNVSFCFVYRQKTPETVEVFMRGMINPLGDIRPSFCVISLAEALVSVATNIHVAQMKKLTWLLRTSRSRTLSAAANTKGLKSSAAVCKVCNQGRSLMISTKLKSCEACLESVCGKCCITKKLSYMTASKRNPKDTDVSQLKFTFCTRCALRAYETSAITVAIDEVDDPHDAVDLMRLRSTTISSRRDTNASSASSLY